MKIIKLNVNDIILDHKNSSALINKNCFGKIKRSVAGAYLKGDNLIVWMEPRTDKAENDITEYIITQLDDPSEGAIVAEVKNRFVYGFSTVTFFEVNDKMWSFFAKHKPEKINN